MSESNEAEHRVTGDASLREVIQIGWPIVIGMLSLTAMGVADTLVVGWLGTTELAAVGLATMAMYLINSFFLGSLHGVKVLASQARGAGDEALMSDTAVYGVALAVPFGLIVLALSGVDAEIFRLLGGPAEVQAVARDYFGVRVLAIPMWYVTVALCDYFQGTGDTRTPMKINLVANGVNIALDLALVFGFGPIPALGVEGAAWATVAASAVGVVMVLWVYLRRGLPALRWRPSVMVDLLKLGLPIGVRYLLGTAGFAMFTSFLARMGEAELAAHQVGVKIISVSFLPGIGIGEAASILVGQYVGAGRMDLARKAFLNAVKLSVGVMAAFGVVFFLFPEALYRLFVDDPAVLRIGRDLMIVAAFFQVFDAIAMTAVGGLNGAGDTRFTMLASIACNWLVLVPSAYALGVVLNLGAVGTWVGLMLEVVVLAALAMVRFYQGAWEGKGVVEAKAVEA